ncbi:MAG: SpoIIE family protein phosphatase [Flavobacteriales bacterium]|nr:SpoIIE family protein phosphatase [Flavobacteriales bacterium]MCB9363101.1 SpoIIE family protein phosphatase [Flavobacteriales bacterium]
MKNNFIRSFAFIFLFFALFLVNIIAAQNFEEQIKQANQIYLSNPDSSFQLCKSIELELKKTTNDELLLAKTELCKTRYLTLKAKFEEASEILNKIIPVFEAKGELSLIAKCYSMKSIIANKIREITNAIEYNQKAFDFYKKAKNLEGQIATLTNRSFIFLNFKLFDSAYTTLNQLFFYETKMTNKDRYFFYQNFGNYYTETGDYNNAIINFKKAITFAEQEKLTDSKVTALTLISIPHRKKKEYDIAFNYINKSIVLAKKNNLIYELNEAYDELILIYESKNDFKKAYLTKLKNDSISDEIYNVEKINRINQFENQLKLAEKEKVITKQQLSLKEEQLHHSEAKSKITTLIFVVILCLLLIVFVSYIFFRAKKLNQKINAQKEEIEEQKIIVEVKNKEITSSIAYAKRIQNAILPPISLINNFFPDSFIFYLPKDIVAGDFYWMQKVDDIILFAVADCTGHGVPGAMVSVVCDNALNRATRELNIKQPAKILDAVSDIVVETFEKSETDVKDGMDIALCSWNTKTNVLEYAGANNSLYLIRNGELFETKADKQPIGKSLKRHPFTNHNIELVKNDSIYLFSDGYADQFGGPKGKKFMYKAFKQMLITYSSLPIIEQEEAIKSTFFKWKEAHEQVDDICILGVKF